MGYDQLQVSEDLYNDVEVGEKVELSKLDVEYKITEKYQREQQDELIFYVYIEATE